MTHFIASKDGTKIAYTRAGKGPALVLVDGAFCHRNFGANMALPPYLTDDFTVYTYDRRGRGESENTMPYAVEREYEDLQTVIDEAGGKAFVYGISSGAALALEAAHHGVTIEKLVLYEAPYIVDDTRKPYPPDYLDNLTAFIEKGKRGKAVKYFMKTGVGLPGIAVWMMQLMPAWKKMKEAAHTVIYDTMILGDTGKGVPFTRDRWRNAKMPTLVMSGTKSAQWSQNAMKQLATVLPNASHHALAGQTHLVSNKVLAPEISRFLKTD